MRLIALLSSRRLAVYLLVALTAYSFLATWIASPDGLGVAGAPPRQLAAVGAALGLSRPFLAPVFLIAVGLLTLSTAACAWERTRTALNTFRSGRMPGVDASHLAESPSLQLSVGQALDLGAAEASAESALRRLGLRTSRSDGVLVGRGSPAGPVGSAIFHWALVGLFLFAGVGQLTRYEGYVNVLPGETIDDAAEAYELELIVGPLAEGAFSGLKLTAHDVNPALEVDGQDRGGAVLVSLGDGSGEIKRQWVYPNSPLKYGSLIIHRSETLPVLRGRVRADDPTNSGPVTLYYDMDERAPRGFTVDSAVDGAPLEVTVTPLGGQRLEVIVASGDVLSAETVGVGEAVRLPDDRAFVVDDLTYGAQIHVVNDWTVPWIYAMFAIGTIGVAFAIFVPQRAVWLSAVRVENAGIAIHAVHSRRRNDPLFPRLLREALEDAARAHQVNEREVS